MAALRLVLQLSGVGFKRFLTKVDCCVTGTHNASVQVLQCQAQVWVLFWPSARCITAWSLLEAVRLVLQLPGMGSKRFLTTKVDRSVSGAHNASVQVLQCWARE